MDLAAASKRALLVTFQLAILLLAGIPLAAVTQPFVRSFPVVVLVLVGVLLLIVPFWRSATNLHGHVRAGAQVILESLASQSQTPRPQSARADSRARTCSGWCPAWATPPRSASPKTACSRGRTLKELNLRGLTGATVIAIDRGPDDIVYPKADEVLQAGDVLVLTGTEEAVALAESLLLGRDLSRDRSQAS